MAGKFVELNEAAKLLGVSPDELNNMRLKGEIYAVRDGGSWKFKSDEVERVAEERGISLPGAGGEADDVLDLDVGDGGDSSEIQFDLEGGDLDNSPTAIGKEGDVGLGGGGGESELSLGLDDEEPDAAAKTGVHAGGGSELGFEVESEAKPGAASDVSLVPDANGSAVNLVADSSADVLGGDAGSSELDFEGSDLKFSSDLSVGRGGKTQVTDSAEEEDLTIGDDEEIALGEDDELVLEGGSDITGGTGDTGINIAKPSDSGLNLEEEPLDLAGSSVSSLELPEDEELADLDDLEADAGGGAVGVQDDDDFQLAPAATLQADEEDSGSQVIALEDSEAFVQASEEELAATEPVLGAGGDELEGALEQGEAGTVTRPALPEGMVYGPAPEMPYSIWNVLSLLTIMLILGVTGMLMTDLIRNMWTWEETYTASTPVMDMMIRIFGGLEP